MSIAQLNSVAIAKDACIANTLYRPT